LDFINIQKSCGLCWKYAQKAKKSSTSIFKVADEDVKVY